jgi:ATPase family associated with various cellular activities (AAA)/Winged helix domain, variant
VCGAFGLSPFERNVLLLCAAVELDPEIAALCAAAQGGQGRRHPTPALAIAMLPEAHWTALTPARPLRRWRLVEIVEADRGDAFMTNAIRIDERILHYLIGASYLDERLQHVMEPIALADHLPRSYLPLADRIVESWSGSSDAWPVVHLAGDASGGGRTLAAACCRALGLNLHAMRAADFPAASAELGGFVRLWQREAILNRSALLLESRDTDDPATTRQVRTFSARAGGPLFVSGRVQIGDGARGVLRLEVPRPQASEQRMLWEAALGPEGARLNGQLDAIVAQFPLDTDAIEATGRALRQTADTDEGLASRIWETCRTLSRTDLDRLADRIETRSTWDDLILPDEPRETLREIAAHVRRRRTVYETWGFGARGDRGLGISALFAGPSGTGKTLSAEVLANELRLDLYRIDLSQIVSKYIGETEKNLRSIFAAAEHSGAILLFDEADALFGKRTDVQDSHDRYANIEVSYLLQRMEAYRGLAILTTNRKNAIDLSFLRRIRFVVTFPFPDAALRARIWQRTFPAGTPLDAVDVQQLARLNVAGGNIRNIALNAAFLAADLGEPVRMTHLLRSARSECLKIEKPLAAAEIGGWV